MSKMPNTIQKEYAEFSNITIPRKKTLPMGFAKTLD
jgi:hypothetical protein